MMKAGNREGDRKRYQGCASQAPPAPEGASLREIGDRTPLSYAQRNQLIREELGFKSYQEYLASDLWKSIRERVLRKRGRRGGKKGRTSSGKRKERKCYVCKRWWIATQVHHIVYTRDNLRGWKITNLQPVCDLCHRTAEYGDNGEKLTAEEARIKTGELANDPRWRSKAAKIRRVLSEQRSRPPKKEAPVPELAGYYELKKKAKRAVKKNRKRARRR